MNNLVNSYKANTLVSSNTDRELELCQKARKPICAPLPGTVPPGPSLKSTVIGIFIGRFVVLLLFGFFKEEFPVFLYSFLA